MGEWKLVARRAAPALRGAPGPEARSAPFCPQSCSSEPRPRAISSEVADTGLAGEMGSGFATRISVSGHGVGVEVPRKTWRHRAAGPGQRVSVAEERLAVGGLAGVLALPHLSRDGGKARGGTNMTDPPKERYLPGPLSPSLSRGRKRGVLFIHLLLSRPLSGIEAVGKGDWEILAFGALLTLSLCPGLRRRPAARATSKRLALTIDLLI